MVPHGLNHAHGINHDDVGALAKIFEKLRRGYAIHPDHTTVAINILSPSGASQNVARPDKCAPRQVDVLKARVYSP
jgi:hypothetical protein